MEEAASTMDDRASAAWVGIPTSAASSANLALRRDCESVRTMSNNVSLASVAALCHSSPTVFVKVEVS